MFILISDFYLQNNSKYFFARGEWLDRIKKYYPNYAALSVDDVEEIILYSAKRIDGGMFARTVTCAGYSADEDYLRIDYGEVLSDSDINCDSVRKNLYTVLRKKRILTGKEFAPSAVFLDDIRDYKYIKNGGNKILVNQNLLDKLTELVGNNDWIGIVKFCPRIDRIENDAIWNDSECLGKLAFALGKLAMRSVRRPSAQDLQRKEENTAFFLKVCERCIELDPYSSMHKSTLAYFLYDRYKSDHRQEDYDRAKHLYEELIDFSAYSFKEQYRYANLLRTHYELPDNRYAPEGYKEFSRVIGQYDILIEEYEHLNEQEKNKQKNNYRKALYQYVGLQFDRQIRRYWDLYFDHCFQNGEVPDYMTNNQAAELIKKCAAYIDRVKEMSPDAPTAENINDKPGYFDICYRAAQLTMAKGFWALLRNYPPEKYLPFFADAADMLTSTLATARKLKSEGARFMFPDHIKLPLAICCFMESKMDDCTRCFERANPWMQFEQARICLLRGNAGEAINILEQIPEKDSCKRKANVLLEQINGEI